MLSAVQRSRQVPTVPNLQIEINWIHARVRCATVSGRVWGPTQNISHRRGLQLPEPLWLESTQLTLAVRWLVRQYKLARKQFPTRGDKAMRAQSIRGRMELDGLYGPIQAHCPAAEEAGAESNRGQSTVGKYLSALAPKADMPHRQQRLTERAGKGPGSIRHGRRSRVDVEIRSLSFVWAVCAW